ncbi:hypothetical protein HGA89_06230, partial [bacterium]|nr:hypothetical protein [bacterium]
MAIPFIHVQARGSYRELGRAVGEAARDQVQASVDFFHANFATMTGGRLTFSAAEELAPAYAAAARRWLPRHVEELEGLAEGARVPFTRLLVLNCGEEFTSDEPVVGEARGESEGDVAGEAPGAGPADTGKTVACCLKAHTICASVPGAQGAMVRKTFNSLVGTVVQTFKRV